MISTKIFPDPFPVFIFLVALIIDLNQINRSTILKKSIDQSNTGMGSLALQCSAGKFLGLEYLCGGAPKAGIGNMPWLSIPNS